MKNIDNPMSLSDKMPVTEVMRADEVNGEVFDTVNDNTINVIPAEGVKTEEKDIKMVLGQKKVLVVDMEPWVSNTPDMVWETSDPTIIFINPTSLIQGTVEAIKVGSATVTATNPLDNTMTKTWNIEVIGGTKAPEEDKDNAVKA